MAAALGCKRIAGIRIGLIAPEFPPEVGGMELYAHELALALSEHDNVTVFAQQENECRSNSFAVLPTLSCDIREDEKHLRDKDVDVWILFNAGYAPLSHRLSQPTLVYCHGNDFLDPWILLSRPLERKALGLMRRIPGVGRLERELRAYLNQRRVGSGLGAATAVLTNSQHTRNRLVSCFPRLRSKVRVIHPGVSDRFYTTRPRKGHKVWKPGSELRLITIARLNHAAARKNIDGVLRALSELRRELDYSYTIIGDGDLRAGLEDLAAELDLADRVRFLGKVSNEEILKQLDQSHLFVMVSHETERSVEGFGIVYGEAAARGVPALANRNGGASDAVIEGVSGVLVDESTPDAIAAGIREFCARASQFPPDAVAAAAEQYRWSATVRHFRSELGRLHNGHGRVEARAK